MKTKTIPDEPILIGELIRRRPIAQGPRSRRVRIPDRQEQAKALFFQPFCNTKFFYRLVMNKQKRHA